MRWRDLMLSPADGWRWIVSLVTPEELLEAIERRECSVPDELLGIDGPLLGSVVYALAREDRGADDLVRILAVGPSAIHAWAATVIDADTEQALQTFVAHPAAAEAARVWHARIVRALAHPLFPEMAERHVAQERDRPDDEEESS